MDENDSLKNGIVLIFLIISITVKKTKSNISIIHTKKYNTIIYVVYNTCTYI